MDDKSSGGEGPSSITPSGPSDAVKDQVKEAMRLASTLVGAAGKLPKTGMNYELYASFPTFACFMQEQQERIVNLMSRVYKDAGVRLHRFTDVEEFLDRVVDANDAVVERAGITLDQLSGRKREIVVRKVVNAESTSGGLAGLKQKLVSMADPAVAAEKQLKNKSLDPHETIFTQGKVTSGHGAHRVYTGAKPQQIFGFHVDVNNTPAPFIPRLRVKHHTIKKSENKSLVIKDDEREGSRQWASDEATEENPYHYELSHLEIPKRQLVKGEAKKPLPLKETQLEIIYSLEGLEKLKDTLNKCDEFAVDLEANDHRSYLGFVCLMQISTREKDFVIDPFPIWKHMHILNEPFTNPSILKVFHGADSDIIWLQRDFSIFVVNMFDTGQAMRLLKFQKFSLAHLVQHYTGENLDKEYQRADWRIRPLPEDFLEYARLDTHWLLYCYDRLRQELVEQGNKMNNLCKAAFGASTRVCMKMFTKPVFEPEGWRAIVANRKALDNRQEFALAELWKWREETARAEDESLQYTLPNHMMVHIAEVLPREMQGIIACCAPVPPLVKENLLVLHKIVHTARGLPVNARPRAQTTSFTGTGIFEARVDQANRMTALKALARSPLDFSHTSYEEEIKSLLEEASRDMPEDVDLKKVEDTQLAVLIGHSVKKKRGGAMIVVGEMPLKGPVPEVVKHVEERLAKWATPYECYLLGVQEAERKFAEERKREEEKRRKEEEAGVMKPKTAWSHMDDVAPPPKKKTAKNSEDIRLLRGLDSGSEESEAEEGEVVDEESTLTKKALKKKRKQDRKKADLILEESSTKKQKKVEEREENRVTPIDYSKFDKEKFNQKADARDSYDPRAAGGGKLSRGGGGRGRKGRGGRGRGGLGATSHTYRSK